MPGCSAIGSSFYLALAALTAAGCQATPVLTHEYAPAPVRSAAFGSMHNVSQSGAVWIGSFPSPADLDLASRRGVAAAIDLTASAERPDWDVAATCANHAIEYVPIGIEARQGISDHDVDQVLAELRARAGSPVLLFCAHGDRAAMLLAIHRVFEEGVPLERALVEARRAGMKAGRPETFVRTQVDRLAIGFESFVQSAETTTPAPPMDSAASASPAIAATIAVR